MTAARNSETVRPLPATFARDLRRAVPDVALALALAGIIFAILFLRVRSGRDPALAEMPSMGRNGGVWPYTASQALGFAALLWSWATILLGLSLPVLRRRGTAHMRDRIERLHRSTSLTVIGLVLVHALLLVFDRMGDTLLTVLVPWTSSYVPGRFPQSLGIVSFYLALAIGPSFYFRDRLGPRTWLVLHRWLIPAVYVLAVWHTFLYGSDMGRESPLWFAVWAFQIPVVAAFVARLAYARGPTSTVAPGNQVRRI